MNLFFAEELNPGGGSLGKEESHHAARVLRMSAGDELLVTQGKGIIYKAEIQASSKSEVSFKNLDIFKEEQKKNHTHIAIAPTKSNERFEIFLEKATELGVDEITPLICQNSERKVYKTNRGQKVLMAGAKQSLSCWWPSLNEPVKFGEFLNSGIDEDLSKFIAYCGEGEKKEILKELPSYSKVLMLIGPEGDFSEKEAKEAVNAGFDLVSLGPKRLRTETAGLAVALVRGLLG